MPSKTIATALVSSIALFVTTVWGVPVLPDTQLIVVEAIVAVGATVMAIIPERFKE